MMYKDTYYITNKNLKYFFVSLFRLPPGPRALLACLSCRYAGPVISGAVISETSSRPPGINPDVDPPTAECSVLAPVLGQQTSPPGAWSYSNRGLSPNHNRVNGVLWRDGFCEGTNTSNQGISRSRRSSYMSHPLQECSQTNDLTNITGSVRKGWPSTTSSKANRSSG